MKLRISHEYSGMGDYWGGNGRRWDNDAGCLFATYDGSTTLQDIVEQWVNDFCMGGDCDSFPADIDGDDLHEAIYSDFLNDRGRADYESGALADCAKEFADHNPDWDDDDDYELPVCIILVEVIEDDE